MRQPFVEFQSQETVESTVRAVLRDIDGVTADSTGASMRKGLLVQAMQNTWSRAARRRKNAGATSSVRGEHGIPALRCRIRCLETESNSGDGSQRSGMVVEFDWVEGDDRGLFESFTSHVSRKLKAVAKASDVDME